jgi:hypothetical protein
MSSVNKWGDNQPTEQDVAELQRLLDEADSALKKATEFAREHNMSFSYEGPSYGMGGLFDPEETTNQYGDESDGWQASSQSC